mmetsp:Transcript_105019/g.240628  ORF Transcript_105019/g.240628 Transcript_105019/m.240628 type:complete len:247 (-) Transcript_105019:1181-1921(-)
MSRSPDTSEVSSPIAGKVRTPWASGECGTEPISMASGGAVTSKPPSSEPSEAAGSRGASLAEGASSTNPNSRASMPRLPVFSRCNASFSVFVPMLLPSITPLALSFVKIPLLYNRSTPVSSSRVIDPLPSASIKSNTALQSASLTSGLIFWMAAVSSSTSSSWDPSTSASANTSKRVRPDPLATKACSSPSNSTPAVACTMPTLSAILAGDATMNGVGINRCARRRLGCNPNPVARMISRNRARAR